MKQKLVSVLITFGMFFTLNSCSTPEERATPVEGADSSQSQTSKTDSSGSGMKTTSTDTTPQMGDSSNNPSGNDSTKTNQKVKTFRHTPIDTITSKSGSSKNN